MVIVGFVTWLPKVLRNAGLDVHVLDGAETRSTRSSGFDLNAIIWHHTATGPNWQDGHVAALLRDGRRDLAGPLSQVGVERDGTWVIVAMGRANHNGYGTYGNNSLGLEFYNDGVGEPWSKAQVDAGVIGIAAIKNHLKWDVPLLGHKESDPGRKIDPNGLNMDGIRAQVKKAQTGGVVIPKPLPTPPEEDEMAAKLFWFRETTGSNRLHCYTVVGNVATWHPTHDSINLAKFLGTEWGVGNDESKSVMDPVYWKALAIMTGPLRNTGGLTKAQDAALREILAKVRVAGSTLADIEANVENDGVDVDSLTDKIVNAIAARLAS